MKILYSVVTIVCSLLMCGCFGNVEKNYYYEPLNSAQQDFYKVQTMYEGRRYAETIQSGSTFLDNYKRDALTVAVRYYIGSSYQGLDDNVKAEQLFKQILTTNPNDEWGKLATVSLEEVKEEMRAEQGA